MGALIVAIGEAIRLWAVHHIGAISRTRSDRLGPLVSSGPFALIRNPLYVGNILLWAGFAISAQLVWLAPIIVVLLTLEYHAIVRWEEGLLTERIGEPYVRYVATVPRWLPSFRAQRTCANGRGILVARDAVQRARDFDRDRRGLSALVAKGSFLSVCQRYQHATDRYGRHASPSSSIRFGLGRLRSLYSR